MPCASLDNSDMNRYALIVAGGQGMRMGSEVPKQFLLLGGKPVLLRTLERFRDYDQQLKIVLVLPSDQRSYWSELCVKYNCQVEHVVADGGESRFHSVRNGLALIDGEGVVAIHDGVRPFVSLDVIQRCFEQAAENRAVIPVLGVVDTVRELTELGSRTVDRSQYRLVQTPQTFDLKLIKQAYRQVFDPCFTDDASVVEALGEQITLIEGNRENIKITTPFDLKIGNALL